ncbi:MAG: mechanosensitive ion channel, partial [Candidatus Heimdallarchaeota archaeon]|nr:mechanosensitive ion channel [Candidatus Heimdallarchaeota archaeon]
FLGSIISFASIHTIQNFISGMYILITEPFSVNDMVKIGNSEGVVTEISLNYTSLLTFEGLIENIPNKKIIGSTIVNFDLKVKDATSTELSWSKKFKKSFDDREITRYTFVWGAPLIDYSEMTKILDKICKKYEKVFGYLPEYIPEAINHRFEFSFALSADDPVIILKNKTDFLDEISLAFH